MSWHESVVGEGPHGIPDGCSGVGFAFWRVLIWPVASSAKSRGVFTTAAFWGAASGTLITSIRNCDSSWSKCGVARVVPAGRLLQPASSKGDRTPAVPLTYT